MATSGFGFNVIIGGSLCVSGPFILHIFVGTISKVSYGYSAWHCC